MSKTKLPGIDQFTVAGSDLLKLIDLIALSAMPENRNSIEKGAQSAALLEAIKIAFDNQWKYFSGNSMVKVVPWFG